MYRVSAVSYLNTLPFVYGLKQKGPEDMDLSLDMPSQVAARLLDGRADIGLLPVAVIPFISQPQIISGYCIGAVGAVDTVLLYSQVPIKEITRIYLDYQSRTSVRLMRLLAEKHWKIEPEWINATPGFEQQISGSTAGVVIGDRTFSLNGRFPYSYDLAEAWQQMTGLPFVFAAWVANKPIDPDFELKFSDALAFGLKHKQEAISGLNLEGVDQNGMLDYLENSISYNLDKDKRKGMELFLKMIGE